LTRSGPSYTARREHDRAFAAESSASLVAPLLQPLFLPHVPRQFTKEDHYSMRTGSTSVREFAFRSRSGGSATFVRVGLAVAIASAPVTGALAQGTQAPLRNNQQQRQTEGQPQPTPARLIVPITGTLATAETATSAAPTALEREAAPAVAMPTALEGDVAPAVTGSFAIQRFARTTAGGVAAVGVLTLSITDSASSGGRTIITRGVLPLARGGDTPTLEEQAPASPPTLAQGCETLSLVLGRVNLDLPGRAIQLDEVHVDLVQGPGDRLGTVMCEVAGLLGGTAPPAELVKALNTLLDMIG
jgi:hypothetical protein